VNHAYYYYMRSAVAVITLFTATQKTCQVQ